MKKSVLGLTLLGLVASASASAAVVQPVAGSYNLASGTASFTVTETSTDQFYEFLSPALGGFTSLTLTSASNTNMTYALWEDLDGILNSSVTLSWPSSLVTSGFITGGNFATLNLLPNKIYALQIFADANGGGVADVVAAVPVPAAAWLFGSAVVGAGALRRKQKATVAA